MKTKIHKKLTEPDWKHYRDWGLVAPPSESVILGSNSKVVKSAKVNYLTATIQLSPAYESVPFGGVNACANATTGCREGCLKFSGFNNMETHKIKRISLFIWYLNDKQSFLDRLEIELRAHVKRAEKKGMKAAVRPNTLSDIRKLGTYCASWAKLHNLDLQVYDYTKLPKPWEAWRENYHITFSRSENNYWRCTQALAHGINVAVVFDIPPGEPLPKKYTFDSYDVWYPVVDGDKHDCTFIHGTGNGPGVVGLRIKGTKAAKAAARASGFAVPADSPYCEW